MFDTTKIGKKIKEARIAQNMTQMGLADAMEVSFQAVSNWERGNSMPDISKLEQLCEILQINVEELLGMNSTTDAFHKIIKKEDAQSTETISLDDIGEVLPLVPPQEAKKLVEDAIPENEKINFSALISIAPFLEEEFLDELIAKADITDLCELAGLAPFLSRDALDKLVLEADINNIDGITSLAPFLSKDTLHALIEKADPSSNTELVVSLAPFLGKETLDLFVEKCLKAGQLDDLPELYPFLSKDSLKKLASYFMQETNMDALQSVIPFC